MKKILLLITSVTLLITAKAQDESFHKNALVLSVGVGGDAYTVYEHYTAFGLTLTQTFVTGCSSVPISLEYGVGKRLGLGLEAKFDKYALKKDSISGFQPTAVGGEFGAFLNYHFIRTHHVDFFAGLNVGYSNFVWTLDSYTDQLYGSGGWGDIHATLRYYFGRLGLFASASFPTMGYNLTSNNSTISSVLNYVPTKWNASGGALYFGIQFRLFNPPA